MLTISRAGVKDAEAILAIQKLAYQSEAKIYNDWSLTPLMQSLQSLIEEFEDSVVLKAVWASQIVGSVRAKSKAGVCLIGRLVVHPNFQGQGIGSKLLKEIEGCFSGCSKFELFTGSKSDGNIRLYKRHGYIVSCSESLSDAVTLTFLHKLPNAAALLVVLVPLLLFPVDVFTEPACNFENLGQRRINHMNPKDWGCMKLLAAQGDAYWQFYVGVQLVNGFDPNGGDYTAYSATRKGNPEGIKLLRSAATSGHSVASANAMNTLGKFYLPKEGLDIGLPNYELAYQWQFLASKQPLFSSGYTIDPILYEHFSPERMIELQKHAQNLLQNR